jgi:hypothetical protein
MEHKENICNRKLAAFGHNLFLAVEFTAMH